MIEKLTDEERIEKLTEAVLATRTLLCVAGSIMDGTVRPEKKNLKNIVDRLVVAIKMTGETVEFHGSDKVINMWNSLMNPILGGDDDVPNNASNN